MTVRISRLASGLTVATDRMDSVETVSVGVYVDVGTRQESAETNGVAHLLEHMAFKGTTTRSARDIAEQIEAVGGQMNAHTGREQTAYYVKLLKEDLALGVDIIADILLNSSFAPEELERERGVILQELGQVEDTPDDVIFDRFGETAYPGQAVGRPILGRAEIIETLPRDALVSFCRRHYGASQMVLCAAGRVDHEALVAIAERAFAALAPKGEHGIVASRWVGGEYREADDLEQVHLVIGFPGVSFTDPDYWAVNVLATMLGGGMSSRLFQEIRERRGLCYAISAWSGSLIDGGSFGVYTGTGADEVVELMPVLTEELRRAGTAAPATELSRARAQIRAGLLMGLESTSARMDALGSQILTYGRPLPPEEIVARVDAVDAERVATVARRLFSGPPTLAAIGPISRLEPLVRIRDRLA
ncbi:MAG: insulinase family protein [Alphaproteobacteria bacterium]|nr:insulinase family protein [Alphaproteobacteria bacterium]